MSSVKKGLSPLRVEHQIHEILTHSIFKLHTNESLLTCCTLLLLLQEDQEQDLHHSTFIKIVSQNKCILDFAFRLIVSKFDSEPILARMSVRIFMNCLLECKDTNELTSFTKNFNLDWNKLIDTLGQHLCEYDEKITSQNSKLGVFTLEFMHLMVLVVQKLPSTLYNSESLFKLIPLLIDVCISCRKLELRADDPTSTEDGDVLALILNRTASDNLVLDWTVSLTHVSAEFLTLCIPKFTKPPYPLNMMDESNFVDDLSVDDLSSQFLTQSIFNHTLLLNVIKLLFLELESNDEIDASLHKETCIMLHYACLSLMMVSVKDCDSLLQNVETSQMIQKLLFSGFASNGDITFHSVLSANHTSIIRSMTLSIISVLLDNNGHSWLCRPKDSKSPTFDFSLDIFTPFCSMARLVAGELRVVLGLLMDNFIDSKDPDKVERMGGNDGNMERNSRFENDYIQRGIDCVHILLHVLNVMVGVAKEDDDEIREIKQETLASSRNPMSTDAILHIRHTLEDAFNSCTQYLSGAIIDNDIDTKQNAVHLICCRYIGGYLTEVNIFDYFQYSEDEANDLKHQYHVQRHHETQRHNDDQQSLASNFLSTTDIFHAIKNGLSICSKSQNDAEDMNYCSKESYTLFPCIVTSLVCCEENKHAKSVLKFILNDSVISDTLLTFLGRAKARLSNHGILSLDDDTINCISWCCILIKSILDFDATHKPKSFPSCLTKSSRQTICQDIYEISKHVGLFLSDLNDSPMKHSIIPLLVNLVDCWIYIDNSSNPHTTLKALHEREDQIIMMKYHVWLETNGYL